MYGFGSGDSSDSSDEEAVVPWVPPRRSLKPAMDPQETHQRYYLQVRAVVHCLPPAALGPFADALLLFFAQNLYKLLNDAGEIKMQFVMSWETPGNCAPGFVIRWGNLLRPHVWDAAKPILVRYRLMRSTNAREKARASFNRKLREWMFTSEPVNYPESERKLGTVFYYQKHYGFYDGCEWWRLPLGRMELRRELFGSCSPQPDRSAVRRALKAQI